jgi:hypothetical protein
MIKDGREIQFRRRISLVTALDERKLDFELKRFMHDIYWKATLAVIHLGYCPGDCHIVLHLEGEDISLTIIGEVVTRGGPPEFRRN